MAPDVQRHGGLILQKKIDNLDPKACNSSESSAAGNTTAGCRAGQGTIGDPGRLKKQQGSGPPGAGKVHPFKAMQTA